MHRLLLSQRMRVPAAASNAVAISRRFYSQSVLVRSSHVPVSPGSGFGSAGEPQKKSKSQQTATGSGDDWAPPDLAALNRRYHELQTRRIRILLVFTSALSFGLSIRLLRQKMHRDADVAERDLTISKLKESTNPVLIADRVLTIVDNANDSKRDIPALRSQLVTYFDSLSAAAAAPKSNAPPTAAAAAPAAATVRAANTTAAATNSVPSSPFAPAKSS